MTDMQNPKDLIVDIIDTLRACEDKLDMEKNSELVNKINELLGRTEAEFANIFNNKSLQELVTYVKTDDDLISDDELDSLLVMLGI